MNEIIDYYNRNAETFIDGTLHADMSDNRGRFLKHVVLGGRILDAGCGSGRDTAAFMNSGYIVDAFDESKKICRIKSGIFGIPVECKRFEDLSGFDEYDGILGMRIPFACVKEDPPGCNAAIAPPAKTKKVYCMHPLRKRRQKGSKTVVFFMT